MRIILLMATALFLGGVAVHTPAANAQPPGFEPVCHVPPGHPELARTLMLPPAGVAAHRMHGDQLGECGGTPPPA